MTYTTSTLLDQLQSQTESLLQTAVQHWQMIPPARFSAQAPDGGWSAAQCLDHLNGYGDYYLPLLQGAIKRARTEKRFARSFRPGWLGAYFTKLMEPQADGRPTKKMKAFKQHSPGAGVPAHEAIATFISQQETLLQLLESARGLDLGRRAIPMSIASFIRLKTGDTFRFIIAHNRRHCAQAQRALDALNAKNAAEFRSAATPT